MDNKTRELRAQPLVTGVWGSSRRRVASATVALLLAVATTALLLGGGRGGLTWLAGPGATWLPFAGNVSWLPYRNGVSWLPFAHGPGGPTHPPQSPAPAPVVIPAAASTPLPTPLPSPSDSPTPTPTATPTAVPTATPRPTPTAEPTHAPTPTPTPTPSPSPSPSPAPNRVLFHDDFEADPIGYTAAGWTLSPTAAWYVAADGTHVLSAPGVGFPTAMAGDTTWTDYRVSADLKTNPTDGHARIVARHASDGYFYACGIDHPGTLFLGKEYGGTWYEFANTPFSYTTGIWYHIDFSVTGTYLTCTVTDKSTGTQRSATVSAVESYFPNGGIGATGDKAEFDNFVVTSIP